jgi:hypothetical protein
VFYLRFITDQVNIFPSQLLFLGMPKEAKHVMASPQVLQQKKSMSEGKKKLFFL